MRKLGHGVAEDELRSHVPAPFCRLGYGKGKEGTRGHGSRESQDEAEKEKGGYAHRARVIR